MGPKQLLVSLALAPWESCKLEEETDIAPKINGEFIYNWQWIQK